MEETFDPNLSLFLSTEGDIIKNIMDASVQIKYWNMFAFLLVWYLFTIITYGTFVPAGLFLPGMIIGCSLGEVMFRTMDDLTLIRGGFEEKRHINKSYIILGCAGMTNIHGRLQVRHDATLVDPISAAARLMPALL